MRTPPEFPGGVRIGSEWWWERLLQVGLELEEDAVEELVARLGAGDGVGLAREELQVIGNAGVDEWLEELDGVGEVDVVVAGALGDEEAAFEVGGVGDGGVGGVDGSVGGGKAEVALGVGGVVVAPVGDGSYGDAGTDAVGMGHGVQGEAAAPAPAPPADALGIELRVAGEGLIERGDLVGELDGAEGAVGGLLEVAATATGAAIVDVEDGEAVLGEQFIEKAAVAPGVADAGGG